MLIAVSNCVAQPGLQYVQRNSPAAAAPCPKLPMPSLIGAGLEQQYLYPTYTDVPQWHWGSSICSDSLVAGSPCML